MGITQERFRSFDQLCDYVGGFAGFFWSGFVRVLVAQPPDNRKRAHDANTISNASPTVPTIPVTNPANATIA